AAKRTNGIVSSPGWTSCLGARPFPECISSALTSHPPGICPLVAGKIPEAPGAGRGAGTPPQHSLFCCPYQELFRAYSQEILAHEAGERSSHVPKLPSTGWQGSVKVTRG